MSEFSESFHLRSDSQQDGEDLLRRAGFAGAVFSPMRGWVTIVPESELFEATDKMVASNQGLLLHYLYAEDHGWKFELYKNSSIISQYECGWESNLAVNDSDLNLASLVSLLIDKPKEKGIGGHLISSRPRYRHYGYSSL
jgi:hypothetical protein